MSLLSPLDLRNRAQQTHVVAFALKYSGNFGCHRAFRAKEEMRRVMK